jgi:murein DD-endopeptidase MepM/ murein hydrolase activator NlpD
MPIAFAALGLGVLLLISGFKGLSIGSVLSGDTGNPLDPKGGSADLGIGATSPITGTAGDIAGGLNAAANAQPGSPIPGTPPHAPTHQTDGLPGFPAFDYMAPAGSSVVSPTNGRIIKLSGHDPSMGPTSGPHGPFGYSIYIEGGGHTYFLTHLGSRTVHVGQSVKQGDVIGTVGDYAKWGGANHVHQGVH